MQNICFTPDNTGVCFKILNVIAVELNKFVIFTKLKRVFSERRWCFDCLKNKFASMFCQNLLQNQGEIWTIVQIDYTRLICTFIEKSLFLFWVYIVAPFQKHPSNPRQFRGVKYLIALPAAQPVIHQTSCVFCSSRVTFIQIKYQTSRCRWLISIGPRGIRKQNT